MRNLISFMHISLDGFVAGPSGEMDWIKHNEELFSYIGMRIRETDTALYGRVTYQMMESYWPTAGNKSTASKHEIEHSKWYRNVHKVVLSKSIKSADSTDATIISDNLYDRISEIKRRPGKDIYLFGSPRATHSLIQQDLVDGFWLFVNPVILGNGIPLFKDIHGKIELKLLPPHRQFSIGVTELNYFVERI